MRAPQPQADKGGLAPAHLHHAWRLFSKRCLVLGGFQHLAGRSPLLNSEVCLIVVRRLWGSHLLARRGEPCLALLQVRPGSSRGRRAGAVTGRDSLGRSLFRHRHETRCSVCRHIKNKLVATWQCQGVTLREGSGMAPPGPGHGLWPRLPGPGGAGPGSQVAPSSPAPRLQHTVGFGRWS